MIVERIKRIYRLVFRNPPKSKITYKAQVERHGNDNGGWNILANSLNSSSIVYSVGIGEDISFDLSIIKKYGCKIYGFDPTPRVASWLSTQSPPVEFLFYPIGLSHEDGTLVFYSPENENFISHKAYAEPSSKAIEVKCQKLGTISKNLGHTSIDLLKIDIEGFEYNVLLDIISSNIRPKQLLVEFHHFFPEVGNAKTEDAIQYLEANGYRLFDVADSFCEYSFIYVAN
jgi:FkbM family methyltransferase